MNPIKIRHPSNVRISLSGLPLIFQTQRIISMNTQTPHQ